MASLLGVTLHDVERASAARDSNGSPSDDEGAQAFSFGWSGAMAGAALASR